MAWLLKLLSGLRAVDSDRAQTGKVAEEHVELGVADAAEINHLEQRGAVDAVQQLVEVHTEGGDVRRELHVSKKG